MQDRKKISISFKEEYQDLYNKLKEEKNASDTVCKLLNDYYNNNAKVIDNEASKEIIELLNDIKNKLDKSVIESKDKKETFEYTENKETETNKEIEYDEELNKALDVW